MGLRMPIQETLQDRGSNPRRPVLKKNKNLINKNILIILIKMEFEISKITERGQVTIPQEFRKELNLKTGEKILFIKEKEKLILEPMKKTKSLERLKEDLIDTKIAEQFWKDVKSGKVKLINQTEEEFLKDLETW